MISSSGSEDWEWLIQAAQLMVEKPDGRRAGDKNFTSMVDTAVYSR